MENKKNNYKFSTSTCYELLKFMSENLGARDDIGMKKLGIMTEDLQDDYDNIKVSKPYSDVAMNNMPFAMTGAMADPTNVGLLALCLNALPVAMATCDYIRIKNGEKNLNKYANYLVDKTYCNYMIEKMTKKQPFMEFDDIFDKTILLKIKREMDEQEKAERQEENVMSR